VTRAGTGRMARGVSLRDVTRENVRAVCELELAEGQEPYVAPASFTVAEGAYEPYGWVRAIYAGEAPVGVLLIEADDPARPRLVRLMIDSAHQRRGIGREAIALAAEAMRETGAAELVTSYHPGPLEPAAFYVGCGFRPTGEEDHGEPVLSLPLGRPAA
jgi:diamine N-acetyltransferase